MRRFFFFLLALLVSVVSFYQVYAREIEAPAVAVADDPLVRMPGTQPGQGVSLEGPNQCLNCHGDTADPARPGQNWMGSMMAQSARDFLFWAALTVAAQDAIWAVGNANATDICIRCHFPNGWVEGRSDPTNGALMTGTDFDGVQCTTCHYLVDPFYETTYSGAREGNDWSDYWDETNESVTPSATAANETYLQDQTLAGDILLFNGDPFIIGNLPPVGYDENGGGQYFLSPFSERRASFADANANHGMLYSRFHKSKYFCNSCHDVSNPVLRNLGADPTQPLPTELEPAYSYYHVERTFSEFMLSAYGQQGGAPGLGPFAPDQFDTSRPNDNIASCQDCHMADVAGVACKQNGGVFRPAESTEHPKSGVPQHDLTGGNMWVSYVLASANSGSPNYDAVNDSLLNQGASTLTLDLTQGDGLDPVALLDGVTRAEWMLQSAAIITDVVYAEDSGALTFRIQNQTGHKLISGYPEGRRMFANVRFYDDGDLIYEVNPYDVTAGTLRGLPGAASSPPLGANETYVDALVYEMHPQSALTGEDKTAHFVLGTDRYKDNRIPPLGFRIAEATERLIEPVWQGRTITETYYTSAEYAGGFDAVDLTDFAIAVPDAEQVEINLFYQTTSREYVEFLRDEINGTATTLPPEAYVVQTDPFFDGLRAWGNTIWELWLHNKDVPGAAPALMATAALTVTEAAVAPQPSILAAAADVTLAWQHHGANDAYDVWRSSDPYFAIGPATGLLLETITPTVSAGSTISYTDSGAAGNPAANYYYRIDARNDDGSASSGALGVFNFALSPGTAAFVRPDTTASVRR